MRAILVILSLNPSQTIREVKGDAKLWLDHQLSCFINVTIIPNPVVY